MAYAAIVEALKDVQRDNRANTESKYSRLPTPPSHSPNEKKPNAIVNAMQAANKKD